MNCSIILAAGQGKRMKSEVPKILHKILGRSMLEYVVDAHRSAGIEKIFLVISRNGLIENFVKDKFPDVEIRYQTEPLGTGDAVKRVLNDIEDDNFYLITPGDVPLLTGEVLSDFISKVKSDFGILTTNLPDPYGYGRIVRKGEYIDRIVEEKDATDMEKQISEVNSGIFFVKGKILKDYLPRLSNNNVQKEYYLTDIVSLAGGDGVSVTPIIEDDFVVFQGVNTRKQLVDIEKEKQKRINLKFLENGVTIHLPETVLIEEDVDIGKDTEIFPFTRITGKTSIGNNCIIGQNCYFESTVIGDNVEIKDNSYFEEAEVGDSCIIGPMAHLRPKAKLGKNVHIGNYVEIKKSVIGDNTKINHLTYIGDAEIGKDTNIGAGTITCNYDGFNKYKTIIGDRVFIGSDSQLVAPVTIEDDVYIGAGSTITKKVEKGALSLTRAEQRTIPGYTERKRKRMKKD